MASKSISLAPLDPIPVSGKRLGFTLLELLTVMVIVGLLAGLTMARMGGVTNRARLQAEVERIAALDGSLRLHAARHIESASLQIDLQEGQVERWIGSDERLARTIELSRAVQITRFLSATRDVDGGRVTIDYSRQGRSETFALELSTADRTSTWLLFAGLTGQMSQWEEEHDVEGMLQSLQKAGVDAD